jgi:endogenous inhibitor of DNA gyrase (YacG/DUF329 family)
VFAWERANDVKCSECGKIVLDPHCGTPRKTCSDRCRAIRSRRKRKNRYCHVSPGKV